MYQAGIFDLDNTLYDYDFAHKVAMDETSKLVCPKLGIDDLQFVKLYNAAKVNIKNRLTEKVAASHNRLLYFQNILEQCMYRQLGLAAEMYDCYWNTVIDTMRLRDGVLETIKYMKQKNIKFAVCTDMTARIQYRKLEKLDLFRYLDVLVTSEEAGVEKPEKAIFELCLRKLNLKSEFCFFVGDDVEKDVNGAFSTGITPIWLTQNKQEDIDCIQICDFNELYRILNSVL